MVTAILILLAAICKALADVLAWKQSYFVKKFPKLKSDFWKINEVHRKVHYIAKFPVDAWHIANSLGAMALLLLPFVHTPYFAWYIEYPAMVLFGTIFFNIFYNKIFQ